MTNWLSRLLSRRNDPVAWKPRAPETVLVLEPRVILPKASRIRNPRTHIDRGTVIRGPMTVRGKGECTIGKYCAIGEGLRIVTSNHETGRANLQVRLQRRLGFSDVSGEPRAVRIGHACWIGDNVLLLPGSGLGDGCIAGAGALVTKRFPPFSIVGGNPARVLKMRFSDAVVQVLLETAWWEWSEERMARNRRFFDADLSQLSHPEQVMALIEE